MNKNIKKHDDLLFNYLFNIKNPFTINELLNITGLKKTKKNKEEIYHFLQSIDDFVEDKNQFYPKNSFLKDMPIRIQPTEFEIKMGILIPGHRIIPFQPTGRMPDDISITFNGKSIQTKSIKLKMSELLIYYSLMDFQKIPIVNVEDILEENAELEIEVFQMKKIYKNNRFNLNDSLILRSTNFDDGIFALEYDSCDHFNESIFKINKQDKIFIKTLKNILEKDLPFPNVEKQLLYTYYNLSKNLSDDEKWDYPGTALGHLLRKNRDITFSTLPNGRTIFHFVNQSLEDLSVFPDFDELLEEAEKDELDIESIDSILRYLHNNNSITAVRALLFHQVINDNEFNYGEIESYLFDGLEKPYMNKELQKIFHSLLEKEYENIESEFDKQYAYFPITAARKKILDQALTISRFLRKLDSEMIQLEELPKKEIMHLMELDRSFDEILQELETLQLSKCKDVSDVHRIIKIVDKTASELPKLFEAIWEKIE